MIILVGVTINVALNGGLFDTTKAAAAKTEKMAILEEIITMGKWDNKGNLKAEEVKNLVMAKYPNSTWDEAKGKLTITGKHGTYEYKISETKITTWEEEGTDNPDTPVDNKKLVYNKIYTYTVESEGQSITIEVAFSDKYNIVVGDFFNSAVMSKYSYNETTKELSKLSPTWLFGEGEYFELSDDGKIIFKVAGQEDDGTTKIQTFGELELTDRSISELYTTKLNYFNNLYDGIYYCKNTNEAFYIYCEDNGKAFHFYNTLKANSNGSATTIEDQEELKKWYNEILTEKGITILSETSISYNGETYELLQNLE